jgi:hypothetical protein
MDYKRDISGELAEISPLVAGLPKHTPFGPPEAGYWETLPGVVMGQIHLQAVRHRQVYELPEDYFDNFPSKMMGLLQEYGPPAAPEIQAELEEHAPLLASMGRKTVFELPQGYFEQFRVDLPAKTRAKVVSFPRRTQQWFAYAAAAVVAGIMVSAAFIFTDNTELKSSYNAVENINVSEGISKLSEEEIANYLNAHPSTGEIAISAGNEISEPEFQNAVENLSEEEIQQYLLENGEPGEVLPRGI